MSPDAPLIDPRGHQDFVDQTVGLAEHFSEWRAPSGADLGLALIELFAGMAAQVADHLNRVPGRDMLAFLDLIGVRPLPAQAARVPLTFTLADGQAAAFVPTATVAAIPAGGGADEVLYVTERDLALTAAKLVAAYVREPAADRMADVTAAATGATPGPWPAFVGDSLIEHALYLGHDRFVGLPRPRSLTVIVSCVDNAARQAFQGLPIEWSWWDGQRWEPATAAVTTRDDTTVVVSLGDVPDVTPTELSGHTARWLRARLTRAIQLVGPIPGVRSVSVGVARPAGPPVGPDHAFAGTAELDLSRDVYPFGEAPRFNDAFLVASDVFARAGASVIVHVEASQGLPSPVGPSPDLVVAWEVGSATGWVEVGRSGPGVSMPPSGFADATQALRTSGDVTFTVPAVGEVLSLNGVDGSWLRARIVQGDYGKPAHATGQPPTLVPANIAPPSIRSITLSWSLAGEEHPATCLILNDEVWADATVAAQGAGVLIPFEPSTEPAPALHLGFDSAFPNRPTLLYLQVEPRPFDPSAPNVVGGLTDGSVRWDSRGPTGWSALEVVDETEGLGRSGLVGFVGPADLTAAVEFGRVLWWLRVRPGGAAPATSPQLRGVLTNTVWAANASVHPDEALGVSDASPGQRMRTTQAPILGDEVIEVAEGPATPSSPTPAAASAPAWTAWLAVPDFSASGPDDRHYVVDHGTGEIGFGDGQRGRIPPGGSLIRASYRSGGGAVGNAPVGAITELKSALAGVSAVTNHEPSGGGADAETVDLVQERGPRQLRHSQRAVALADYADLAREASAEVARALAVPPPINPLDLAWITPSPVIPPDPAAPPPVNQAVLCHADAAAAADRAALAAGRVAVAVTPNDDTPQPVPSSQLLDAVRQALLARCPAVLSPTDVSVVGPAWVQLTVRAEVAAVSFDAAAALPAAVSSALTRFLHPLHGGVDGAGWPFGRLPHLSDLYAAIGTVPGLDHVRSLAVDVAPDPATLSTEQLQRTLVWSGPHEIALVAQSEAAPEAGPSA